MLVNDSSNAFYDVVGMASYQSNHKQSNQYSNLEGCYYQRSAWRASILSVYVLDWRMGQRKRQLKLLITNY